jgi:acetolactate synthase-1/2/3 large subunit
MAVRKDVHQAKDIGPALRRARDAIARKGKSAVINEWVNRNEYAPVIKNQTMYK